MRLVLELAGIKNAFGKQLGSGNPLNKALCCAHSLMQRCRRLCGSGWSWRASRTPAGSSWAAETP